MINLRSYFILISFFILFLSLKSFSTTLHLQLTDSAGNSLPVDLQYDVRDAVVLPPGNFCSNSQTVATWMNPLAEITANLTVHGKTYLINGEGSFGWSDIPDLGISNIYYYSTFTFKDQPSCDLAAKSATYNIPLSYVGPIKETDLKSMKLSFVQSAPGVGTSAAEIIMRIDFQHRVATLVELKPTGNMFNPSDWIVTGKGPF